MMKIDKLDPIKVLMERDSMTLEEAQELIDVTVSEMQEEIYSGNFLEAEEIWQSNTGLESDYILEVFL